MIELYRHQRLALSYLRINDFYALFMDQGCGKTLPTLTRILELFKSNKIADALVVAPKAVLGSWERDIEKFSESDQAILRKGINLVNYDITWRRPELKKHWGAIVLDEAHYIKNRTSNRSKCLLRLALDSDYRYILTGTPISNGRLEDIWSLYAFLNPIIVNRTVGSKDLGSYREFSEHYCILNQYYQPCSYIHVSELQEIIAEHSYRIKKKDCLDLPEKLPDEVYTIEIGEKAFYKELHKYSTIEEYEILADNPLSRMIKLRQVCSGFINTENGVKDLKCEKIETLKGFLSGYEDKLVIFAQFTHSIDAINALLKKLKIKSVTLDGRQKDKKIWRKFQEDSSIRVIVCQYDSASEGIDLYSADTTIYFEPTLRSNTLEQSRDRTHRRGQTRACSYIHFITKGTIEVAIYRTVREYGDFSEKLFNEYMDHYQRKYDTTGGAKT
ncbi:MAG: DEAD/DEAH box helicase [Parabacteroides sp.]|nr:DEAD/DEAH box helicase [Parabacteroides sp.]